MYVFIYDVIVYWTRLTRTNRFFCDQAENIKNNIDRGDVKSDIEKYIKDYFENDVYHFIPYMTKNGIKYKVLLPHF